MRRSRSRSKKSKKKMGMGIISIVVILFCAIISYHRVELDAKSLQAREEEKKLEAQKNQLENKDEEIEQYKSYIHSEEYIEYLARTKFGLVYPDEIIFETRD